MREELKYNLGKDPMRRRGGVRLILLTADECLPCEELKKVFKRQIEKGDIEVRSVTSQDDWATDLGQFVVAGGGAIPSLVILDSEDKPLITLSSEELGVKL